MGGTNDTMTDAQIVFGVCVCVLIYTILEIQTVSLITCVCVTEDLTVMNIKIMLLTYINIIT